MADNSYPTKIDRFLKRPLLLSSAVFTTVTSLWGIVSIFKDIKEVLGESIALYLIVGLITACLLPALIAFFYTVWKWWFFLPIDITNRYLHLEIARTWEIAERGSARVVQEKSLLFFYPPEKEDLFDMIFSSEPLRLDELNQRSEDCKYVDHHEVSKGVHRVYWQPKKGEVLVGKPYKHKTETHFPFDKVPTYKCMTLPFAASTLSFKLNGVSEIPISKIVAFKGTSSFRVSHSAERLAKRGNRVKRTRAPLARLIDQNHFTWEVRNVSPGETFFVVVYF